MSTRLSLRVQKTMIGEQALSGAVADIIPISEDGKAKAYRGVVIPVSGSDTETIDVVPGRYMVQAYLPSGALLTEQITALPGKTTTAVLEAEQSPHEWLGWQQLVQQPACAESAESAENAENAENAESAQGADNTQPFAVSRRAGPRSQPSRGMGADASQSVAPELQIIEAGTKPDGSWQGLHQLARIRGPIPVGEPIHVLAGKPSAALNVRSCQDANVTSFFIDLADKAPTDRLRYAVIRRGPILEIVSLPLPWNRLDRSSAFRQASLDIAVPRDHRQPVRVAVHDPELGSLLGFVAAGRLPLATTLGKEGTRAHEQMSLALGGKLTNPFAAAVGAYLLLQSDSTPAAYWHSWVDNLANLFPWLPDGKVLQGMLRLRCAATDNDVAAARDALSAGLVRGMPVLAPVLRLLLDGITTLVDDPEADAGGLQASLPSVRAVASVMATDQAFTILRVGDRS